MVMNFLSTVELKVVPKGERNSSMYSDDKGKMKLIKKIFRNDREYTKSSLKIRTIPLLTNVRIRNDSV